MSSFVRASRIIVVAMALSACGAGRQHLAEPTSASSEGTASILQASQEAGAGRYGVADKILADYATRYPASAEAAEAVYWRALYRLDPANQTATPREAVVLLDGYLASGTAAAHRAEAQTLRRVAAALEVHAAAAATAAAQPKPDDKPKDEELARLKDELAKANAELERIKRRLAQPKP